MSVRLRRLWAELRDFASLLGAIYLLPDGTIKVAERTHHGTRKGDHP